jgi:Leucine-rich repeat (LRR) protein
LHGNLPPKLPPNLTTLGLASNNLTGSIAPAYALQQLVILFLRHNGFTGEVGALSDTIEVLDLDHNAFSSVSSELCKGPSKLPALQKPNGCSQDYPTQDVQTCCLAQNEWAPNRDPSISCPALKNCFFPPCTGQSAKLANQECHAWQSFVATTIGPANLHAVKVNSCKNKGAFDLKADPCACGFGKTKDTDDDAEGYDYNYYGIECVSDRANETHISVLALDSLHGSLPREIGFLSQLKILDLGENPYLSGTIPTEIGLLTQLEHLHLYNTEKSGNLTGSIPTTLGALSVLDSLDVYGNKLLGVIPTQLVSLQALARLKLAGNTLTGAIPYNLGKGSNLQKWKSCFLSFDGDRNSFKNVGQKSWACSACEICGNNPPCWC